MPNIGPFELLIIFLIVLLVFGAGRIREVAGGLGGSIKDFRKAVREDDTTTPTNNTTTVDSTEKKA